MSRRIADRLGGGTGRLDGRARFSPDGAGGLVMEESGRLQMQDGPALDATRRYLWRAGEGGVIEVLYADGRRFHRIVPDRLMPDDTHLCEPDLYHVSYDFTGWPVWRTVWRVVGPRKNYRMVTEYRRLAP
ncbi:trigger factor [Maritimibacter sp. 55A14]|nr:trigger factor [Maritimibacter sp. 55A14]